MPNFKELVVKYTEDDSIYSDVIPILQNEAKDAPVAIMYQPEFITIMNFFRAFLQENEYSNRALICCKDAIACNPANYTAWVYLRSCLEKLNCNLYDELKYCDQMGKDHPKNYQLWNHRRKLVEILYKNKKQDDTININKLVLNELKSIEDALQRDTKNYHVWSYRQWLVHYFNNYTQEISFIDKMLNDDIRNNSAWNHKYFVNKETTNFNKDFIDEELLKIMKLIELDIHNDSSWRYLEGFFQLEHFNLQDHGTVIISFSQNILNNNDEKCINALSLLVELCILYIKNNDTNMEEKINKKELASTYLLKLSNYDEIRKMYWLDRLNNLPN